MKKIITGVVAMNNFLIGDFEGPLDLLLHLVKQSKIEISEIKIVDITEQYLYYLKKNGRYEFRYC